MCTGRGGGMYYTRRVSMSEAESAEGECMSKSGFECRSFGFWEMLMFVVLGVGKKGKTVLLFS